MSLSQYIFDSLFDLPAMIKSKSIFSYTFCETRAKAVLKYIGIKVFTALRPDTDRDRYSREIKLYGWNFMKAD